jgi:hypothetical protein
MADGLSGRRAVSEGFNLGVEASQRIRKTRFDMKKLEAEQIEKNRLKRESDLALTQLMGIPLTEDDTTKDVGVDIREVNRPNALIDPAQTEAPVEEVSAEREFIRKSPTQEAFLKQRLTKPDKAIFDEFIERVQPSVHDKYVNYQRTTDKDGNGIIVAINRDTGKPEKIADNPFHKPSVVRTFTGTGKFTYKGQEFGIKGKTTQVLEYDNGQIVVAGVKNPTSKGGKTKSDKLIDFELNMARFEEQADNIRNKRQTYITRDWADEIAKEDYRAGVNSDYNKLAWEVSNQGSDRAQKEIRDIYNKGQQMFTGARPFKMSRSMYYDQQVADVTELYQDEKEISYQEFQTILKFLQYKYKDYLQSEDSVRDQDELNLDNLPAFRDRESLQ